MSKPLYGSFTDTLNNFRKKDELREIENLIIEMKKEAREKQWEELEDKKIRFITFDKNRKTYQVRFDKDGKRKVIGTSKMKRVAFEILMNHLEKVNYTGDLTPYRKRGRKKKNPKKMTVLNSDTGILKNKKGKYKALIS